MMSRRTGGDVGYVEQIHHLNGEKDRKDLKHYAIRAACVTAKRFEKGKKVNSSHNSNMSYK